MPLFNHKHGFFSTDMLKLSCRKVIVTIFLMSRQKLQRLREGAAEKSQEARRRAWRATAELLGSGVGTISTEIIDNRPLAIGVALVSLAVGFDGARNVYGSRLARQAADLKATQADVMVMHDPALDPERYQVIQQQLAAIGLPQPRGTEG
jgi:hypothetical protein